jgi:hypothetical protein
LLLAWSDEVCQLAEKIQESKETLQKKKKVQFPTTRTTMEDDEQVYSANGFIPWPSIDGFHLLRKKIVGGKMETRLPRYFITYKTKVKLHGANSAVNITKDDSGNSNERLFTLQYFCWLKSNQTKLHFLFSPFSCSFRASSKQEQNS